MNPIKNLGDELVLWEDEVGEVHRTITTYWDIKRKRCFLVAKISRSYSIVFRSHVCCFVTLNLKTRIFLCLKFLWYVKRIIIHFSITLLCCEHVKNELLNTKSPYGSWLRIVNSFFVYIKYTPGWVTTIMYFHFWATSSHYLHFTLLKGKQNGRIF